MYFVYGKPGCSYCTRAKNLLTAKNFEFEYLELDVDYKMEDLLEIAPSAKTFPQIFYSGRLVGGYIDLEDEID